MNVFLIYSIIAKSKYSSERVIRAQMTNGDSRVFLSRKCNRDMDIICDYTLTRAYKYHKNELDKKD